MLPMLIGVTGALAERFGIRHVRLSMAKSVATYSAGPLLRNGIMTVLHWLSHRGAIGPAAQFLGLDASGRLDEGYFQRVLPSLQAGQVYELMCHPGHLDRGEIKDPRLLAYHDWEGELATLTSANVRQLLDHHRVMVIGYRDLDIVDGRLIARVPIAATTPLQ
jgi:predicted glycoside hydrolase/deacetylase ChbG (UPF0249 family)